MIISRIRVYVTAFCFGLLASLQVLADDQTYTTAASFIGGAGSTTTNAEYTHISSWRQPIQTTVSSGGEYVNISGFVGAVTDTTFNILSYNLTSSPSPSFQITISTEPGQIYVIQFADGLSSSQAWQSFSNTNQTIGTYLETNTVPATFTFTDDFTPATSGGPSTTSARFYRVVIQFTPKP